MKTYKAKCLDMNSYLNGTTDKVLYVIEDSAENKVCDVTITYDDEFAGTCGVDGKPDTIDCEFEPVIDGEVSDLFVDGALNIDVEDDTTYNFEFSC